MLSKAKLSKCTHGSVYLMQTATPLYCCAMKISGFGIVWLTSCAMTIDIVLQYILLLNNHKQFLNFIGHDTHFFQFKDPIISLYENKK